MNSTTRANWRGVGYAAFAAALGYYCTSVRSGIPFGNTDFDQIWAAARVLLDGGDAYAMIGPGKPVRFAYPFFYPLPAAIIGLPLAPLTVMDARLAFMAVTGGLLGYAIGRYRPWLWPALFSIPYFIIARNVQWGALLTAALIMPWLGPFAAGKLNIALAILAGQRTRREATIFATGALAVIAASLAVDPDWVTKWRDVLSGVPHFAPLITRPGGFLILLALLRSRDPDARLLLGLALVPQTGLAYEALPALTVARTRAEAAFLALMTHVSFFAGQMLHAPGAPFPVESWEEGKAVLWGNLMIPLALVLWRGWRGRKAEPGPEARGGDAQVPVLQDPGPSH
jgi:hypothetical protein